MKKQTKPTSPKIPTPEALLAKANAVVENFDLGDYRSVMFTLRRKGFTFRRIAGWLSNELGRTITHTQVYRLLQEKDPFEDECPAERNSLLAAEFREEEELGKGEENP